jgi:hypothetical protein
MNYSIHDRRTSEDKEANKKALEEIEANLGQGISNYSLESSEDLFDLESNEIVRKLDFSQGTRTYSFVLCSNGFIRMMQEKCPVQLLLDIHNCLISDDGSVSS